jgi:hypothetical protein
MVEAGHDQGRAAISHFLRGDMVSTLSGMFFFLPNEKIGLDFTRDPPGKKAREGSGLNGFVDSPPPYVLFTTSFYRRKP